MKISFNEKIKKELESICIITDKVYSKCSDRKCFSDIKLDIEKEEIKKIRFNSGYIVENSLIISDIKNREYHKRVRFILRIPYDIVTKDGKVISKYLPDIYKDIVLFIPNSRDEFDFKIVVDTHSNLITDISYNDKYSGFCVGVYIIISVVGKVQLLIPAYGFCPEPPECEEYTTKDICDDFYKEPFPDFFPPQFHDIYPGDDEG